MEEQTIISEQAPLERQRRDVRITEKRDVPPIIQEEFSEEENIAEVSSWVEDLNPVLFMCSNVIPINSKYHQTSLTAPLVK